MGMYTEFYFRGELRKDTPDYVIEFLRTAMGLDWQTAADPRITDSHEFFKTDRWALIFGASSAYFPMQPLSAFVIRNYGQQDTWELALHGSLKNYDGEIAKFFDWIDPFVYGSEGKFIGYELYEESDNPILYHKKVDSYSWRI